MVVNCTLEQMPTVEGALLVIIMGTGFENLLGLSVLYNDCFVVSKDSRNQEASNLRGD